MPGYKLRTLLILLAIGPPMLAGVWWAYVWLAGNTYALGILVPVIAVPIFAIAYAVARIIALTNRYEGPKR